MGLLESLRVGGDFSATGEIKVIPASTGNIPGRVVLASREIPNGARALLEKFSAKVIDVGNADQVFFQICRNGVPIQAGVDRIPGVQFDYQSQIELGLFVNAGLIEILAFNISGMNVAIEPSAVAGSDISAQAWFTGKLLSERGGVS